MLPRQQRILTMNLLRLVRYRSMGNHGISYKMGRHTIVIQLQVKQSNHQVFRSNKLKPKTDKFDTIYKNCQYLQYHKFAIKIYYSKIYKFIGEIQMKQPRTYILQQDQHLQNLRKIIKRDYFSQQSQYCDNKQTPKLSLNSYLSNFTSNQNKVFSELVHKDKQQWKKQHWWIDKQDKIKMITNGSNNDNNKYLNMIEGDKSRNGIDTSIVKQKGANQIFFKQQSGYNSYLTLQQQDAKKIMYTNCRLDNQKKRTKQLNKQMLLRITNNNQQQIQHDNQGEQHIMTWGQIQNTPIRIQGSEYRMPDTPMRDQLLDQLTTKITKQKIQKDKKKSQLVQRLLGSVTPSRSSHQRIPHSSTHRKTSQKRSQYNDKMMQGLLNIDKK